VPPLYIIDGFNFLHAVVLKGRDRARWWAPENQAKVVEAVAELRALGRPLDAWVVFDQRSPLDVGGGVETAPGGTLQIHRAPDADDYIVRRCSELEGHREIVVVTADRSLRDRAKNYGARGLSPWALVSYARTAPDYSGGGSHR
jgi:predicted RNA-binding protein with PIN domain